MSTYDHGIEVGDKVEILIGGTDNARYGMTLDMSKSKGEVVEVTEIEAQRVRVHLPGLTFQPGYSPTEVKKVEPEPKFKKGDRVKIIRHGAYGSNSRMDAGRGGYGEVVGATYPGSLGHKAYIRVALDKDLGVHIYDQHELKHAPTQHPAVGKKVVQEVTMAIEDEVTPQHIQSQDELIAENESLDKQIRNLEARVERKKEFQRQNLRKIDAWQVILEK